MSEGTVEGVFLFCSLTMCCVEVLVEVIRGC